MNVGDKTKKNTAPLGRNRPVQKAEEKKPPRERNQLVQKAEEVTEPVCSNEQEIGELEPDPKKIFFWHFIEDVNSFLIENEDARAAFDQIFSVSPLRNASAKSLEDNCESNKFFKNDKWEGLKITNGVALPTLLQGGLTKALQNDRFFKDKKKSSSDCIRKLVSKPSFFLLFHFKLVSLSGGEGSRLFELLNLSKGVKEKGLWREEVFKLYDKNEERLGEAIGNFFKKVSTAKREFKKAQKDKKGSRLDDTSALTFFESIEKLNKKKYVNSIKDIAVEETKSITTEETGLIQEQLSRSEEELSTIEEVEEAPEEERVIGDLDPKEKQRIKEIIEKHFPIHSAFLVNEIYDWFIGLNLGEERSCEFENLTTRISPLVSLLVDSILSSSFTYQYEWNNHLAEIEKKSKERLKQEREELDKEFQTKEGLKEGENQILKQRLEVIEKNFNKLKEESLGKRLVDLVNELKSHSNVLREEIIRKNTQKLDKIEGDIKDCLKERSEEESAAIKALENNSALENEVSLLKNEALSFKQEVSSLNEKLERSSQEKQNLELEKQELKNKEKNSLKSLKEEQKKVVELGADTTRKDSEIKSLGEKLAEYRREEEEVGKRLAESIRAASIRQKDFDVSISVAASLFDVCKEDGEKTKPLRLLSGKLAEEGEVFFNALEEKKGRVLKQRKEEQEREKALKAVLAADSSPNLGAENSLPDPAAGDASKNIAIAKSETVIKPEVAIKIEEKSDKAAEFDNHHQDLEKAIRTFEFQFKEAKETLEKRMGVIEKFSNLSKKMASDTKIFFETGELYVVNCLAESPFPYKGTVNFGSIFTKLAQITFNSYKSEKIKEFEDLTKELKQEKEETLKNIEQLKKEAEDFRGQLKSFEFGWKANKDSQEISESTKEKNEFVLVRDVWEKIKDVPKNSQVFKTLTEQYQKSQQLEEKFERLLIKSHIQACETTKDLEKRSKSLRENEERHIETFKTEFSKLVNDYIAQKSEIWSFEESILEQETKIKVRETTIEEREKALEEWEKRKELEEANLRTERERLNKENSDKLEAEKAALEAKSAFEIANLKEQLTSREANISCLKEELDSLKKREIKKEQEHTNKLKDLVDAFLEEFKVISSDETSSLKRGWDKHKKAFEAFLHSNLPEALDVEKKLAEARKTSSGIQTTEKILKLREDSLNKEEKRLNKERDNLREEKRNFDDQKYDKISELAAKEYASSFQLIDVVEESERLRNLVRDQSCLIDNQKNSIREKEERIREGEERIRERDRLIEALRAVRGGLEKTLDSVKDDKKNKEKEVIQKQEEISSLKESYKDLEQELEKLRNKVAAGEKVQNNLLLVGKNDELTEDSAALEKKFTALKSRCDKLESEKTELEKKIKGLSEQQGELEKSLKKKEAELIELNKTGAGDDTQREVKAEEKKPEIKEVDTQTESLENQEPRNSNKDLTVEAAESNEVNSEQKDSELKKFYDLKGSEKFYALIGKNQDFERRYFVFLEEWLRYKGDNKVLLEELKSFGYRRDQASDLTRRLESMNLREDLRGAIHQIDEFTSKIDVIKYIIEDPALSHDSVSIDKNDELRRLLEYGGESVATLNTFFFELLLGREKKLELMEESLKDLNHLMQKENFRGRLELATRMLKDHEPRFFPETRDLKPQLTIEINDNGEKLDNQELIEKPTPELTPAETLISENGPQTHFPFSANNSPVKTPRPSSVKEVPDLEKSQELSGQINEQLGEDSEPTIVIPEKTSEVIPESINDLNGKAKDAEPLRAIAFELPKEEQETKYTVKTFTKTPFQRFLDAEKIETEKRILQKKLKLRKNNEEKAKRTNEFLEKLKLTSTAGAERRSPKFSPRAAVSLQSYLPEQEVASDKEISPLLSFFSVLATVLTVFVVLGLFFIKDKNRK